MTAKAKTGKERKGIQPGAFPIEVPVTDPEETGRYLHVHLDDEEEQKNLYAAIIRAADMKSPEIVAEHIEPYNHAMRSFQYSSSRIASALSEAVRGHEPMHVASLQARDASRATDRFAACGETVLNVRRALDMLENPPKANKALKKILSLR